jgi:hypothetical protein
MRARSATCTRFARRVTTTSTCPLLLLLTCINDQNGNSLHLPRICKVWSCASKLCRWRMHHIKPAQVMRWLIGCYPSSALCPHWVPKFQDRIVLGRSANIKQGAFNLALRPPHSQPPRPHPPPLSLPNQTPQRHYNKEQRAHFCAVNEQALPPTQAARSSGFLKG